MDGMKYGEDWLEKIAKNLSAGIEPKWSDIEFLVQYSQDCRREIKALLIRNSELEKKLYAH